MGIRTLLFLSLLAFIYGCKSIQPEAPTESVLTIPKINQPASIISVPITIALKPYFDEIEAEIPFIMDGGENNCSGVSYTYHMERDSIRYKGYGKTLDYKVLAKYGLQLNYCPSCTYLFDDEGTCVIPRVHASCGVGEKLRDIEIGYTSSIAINKNWEFVSTTKLNKIDPKDPCKVTFVKYDATDLLVDELRPLLKGYEKDIDSSLQSVNLKETIQEVWNSIEEPFDLEGYGYLYLNPNAIALDKLTFDDKEVQVNLQMELHPKGTLVKDTNYLTPVPNLSEYKSSGGFELTIDIGAPYDSLNKILQKELVGKVIELDKRIVRFENVKVHSTQDQRLNIEVEISGTKKGTLFFTGTPVFHSITQEISIPDLTFDVKTRSVLLKSAKWLFSDRIEKELRKAATFNFTQQLEDIKSTLSKELNSEIEPGVFLNGNIHHLEILDIYPFTHQLYIRLRTKGELSLKM